MEPSPPRKSRELPFYKAPEHIVTSAKIVSDARDSLRRSQLRSVPTRRPETPQDGQRKLFPNQSIRDPTNRPPSAFSLGSRHFESDSRPVSGTRLSPIDHTAVQKVKSSDGEQVTPRPPTDPNRIVKRPACRRRQQAVCSGAEDDHLMQRTTSLHDVTSSTAEMTSDQLTSARRVSSGPTQRGRNIEERGEGDGSEVITRVDSRSGSVQAAVGNRDNESGYCSDTRGGSAGSERTASRKGSGSRKASENSESSLYYTTHIQPIVQQMTTHIIEKDSQTLYTLSDNLYKALENGNLMAKSCRQRSAILKTLFKLLDLDSPKLLLKLASLILALNVTGNNLLNICKLIFKVSRDEQNDTHFLTDNILDLLIEMVGNVHHLKSSPEALIYAVGAVKFLSSNSNLIRHIINKNVIPALARLLTNANKMVIESGKMQDQFGHILVQLTAVLRNLTDVSSTRPQFLTAEVLPQLCHLTRLYDTDTDLILNVCRVLSKLTQHTDCCTVVSSNPDQINIFIHLLSKYHSREDLVVRIGFILGNLTTKNEECRQHLNRQPNFLNVLLRVLATYLRKFQELCEEQGKSFEKMEDVLIKLLRVIANVSMSCDVGPVVAQSETCVDLLIQILESVDIERHEELVLNTVTTVNNLSYYSVTNSAIAQQNIRLSQALLKFLVPDNMLYLAETTRVFGNLSRDREVRDYLVKHKVDEAMVAMLDSDKIDVVFTACGVLINLMSDEEKRPSLKKLGGIQKLTEVLRDWGQTDWQLASMVCQTLWNCSGRIHSANASFGEHDAQILTELLLEYLDEETALETCIDSSMKPFIQEAWQSQFCPVANQLLRRIESHQSKFEPLQQPLSLPP